MNTLIDIIDSDTLTEKEQIEKIKECLANGINIHEINHRGKYPIQLAAEKGMTAVIELLLAHGANVNQVSLDDENRFDTPLYLACEAGHAETALMLLTKGAAIDQEDEGWSPLHYAAHTGLTSVVSALLDKGADIHKANHWGKYPIQLAAEKGMTAIIELLLAHGASVNQVSLDDKNRFDTPLYLACKAGHAETALMLLTKGAAIDQVDEGWSPLHHAAHTGLTSVVNALLDKGADINQILLNEAFAELTHYSPLMLACQNEHTTTATLLIQRDAQLTITSLKGLTALHITAEQGNLEIFKALCQKKAYLHWYANKAISETNVNQNETVTPLSLAIENLNASLVKYLLDNERIIQETFQSLGWSLSPFRQHTVSKIITKCKWYYQEYQSNLKGCYQFYPLHLLAYAYDDGGNAFVKTLRVLLKRGFDINQLTPGTQQMTLLHLLGKIHHMKAKDSYMPTNALKAVIAHGGNMYQEDAHGNTPLAYYFFDLKHPKKHCDFLIQQGYDTNEAFRWDQSIFQRDAMAFLRGDYLHEVQDVFLNYLPQHYSGLYKYTAPKNINYLGLIGQTITQKAIEGHEYNNQYFLAVAVQLEQVNKKSDKYKEYKIWAITEHTKLSKINKELTRFYKILIAHLLSTNASNNDTLQNAILKLLNKVIKKMQAKKKLTLEHLTTLKHALDAISYSNPIKRELNTMYLNGYKAVMGELPKLTTLCLEPCLSKEVASIPTNHTVVSVIETVFENHPVKTVGLQSNFYRLTFFKSPHTLSGEVTQEKEVSDKIVSDVMEVDNQMITNDLFSLTPQ